MEITNLTTKTDIFSLCVSDVCAYCAPYIITLSSTLCWVALTNIWNWKVVIFSKPQ